MKKITPILFIASLFSTMISFIFSIIEFFIYIFNNRPYNWNAVLVCLISVIVTYIILRYLCIIELNNNKIVKK